MPTAARPHLWGLGETELPRDKLSSFRSKVPVTPSVNPEWHQRPEPTWGKKKAVAEAKESSVAALQERAAKLRQQAQELSMSVVNKPSVRIQLGQILLTMDGKATNEMIQKWDAKGRGEFMKAEMRLNLRNAGLTVTSAESDALFDSWDDDGGGSLDVKELKGALDATMRDAKDYNTRPDPGQQHMQQLLKFATIVEDAAAAMPQADALEADLEAHSARMLTRADVRLGDLLQKRMIKPGEFVVRFSKSTGANAGELSKSDFRKAVLELFNTSKRTASPRRPPSRPGSTAVDAATASAPPEAVVTSPSEIDSVFDEYAALAYRRDGLTSHLSLSLSLTLQQHSAAPSPPRLALLLTDLLAPSSTPTRRYDDDGGGSMDVDEAKAMIKGLQAAGRQAENERRVKDREAKAQRAKAQKKAAAAMAVGVAGESERQTGAGPSSPGR